jgi:hypothetical protein
MSAGATESASASTLSAVVDPYRARLANDSKDFTLALLALAKASAKPKIDTSVPLPEEDAALKVLARWRHGAKHALRRVHAVGGGAPGRKLAERWLKTMIAALDLQRQALSLVDPNQGAAAAQAAHRKIAEYHQLEERLNRVLA